MFMSCIPSNYNEDIDSEDGDEHVIQGMSMPVMYAEPTFSDSLLEEKRDLSENECDKGIKIYIK